MRPAILVLLLAAAIPAAADDVFGPYLQSVGSESVVVRWWTAEPTTAVLEYEPAGGVARAVYSLEPAREHAVRLDGLVPDGAYDYRLTALAGETPFHQAEGRFRTLPIDGAAPIRFVHTGGTGWDGFGGLVDRFDPHLHLAGSGGVGAGGLADWRAHYGLGEVASSAAVYPAIGSGTYGSTGLGGTAFLGHLNAFHQLHTLPGNEEWYAFDAGRVRFFVLDTAWFADPVRLSIDQTEWLDRALREATDGEDDPLFKVVLVNAPPPGSADDLEGVAEEIWTRLVLARLLARRGVDLVLCGSGARTEHVETGGVHWLSTATGRPRAPRWERPDAEPLFADAERRAISTVRVEGNRLDVEVLGEDGAVLHAFRVERK